MKMNKGWLWRDGELTMKQFYNLPQQEQDQYILLIEKLPAEERSSMDEILLNRFNKNNKQTEKFLEL
jgi:hypothetical protein